MAMDADNINDSVREVLEREIESLRGMLDALEDLAPTVDAILDCPGRVMVTGMGKSGLIGRKISATFSSTATPSGFVHPAEALHGDIGTIGNEDLVLVVSGSGETEELLALIPFLKRRHVSIAAICCRKDSTVLAQSDYQVFVKVDSEADPFNLIPTSSTTAMLAVGDALAIAVLRKRGFTREQFAELHPSGSIGRKLLLRVSDLMHTGDQIPTVPAATPLRETVYTMGAKRLGAAFVVRGDDRSCLLGVFTDGDLRRQLEQNENPLGVPVESVMTRDPVTISEHAPAVDAVERMQQKKITVLPVLNGQRLVGALHLHDLLNAGLG